MKAPHDYDSRLQALQDSHSGAAQEVRRLQEICATLSRRHGITEDLFREEVRRVQALEQRYAEGQAREQAQEATISRLEDALREQRDNQAEVELALRSSYINNA